MKDRAKHIMEVFRRGQGKRITSYSSSGSVGALVCGKEFEEAFQQTTPLGFMNTETLAEIIAIVKKKEGLLWGNMVKQQ